MTIKDSFAPRAWEQGGAVRRAAMTLLLCMLTAMTAWAEIVSTYYIDENGTRHDGKATVLTGGGATELAEGTYVVNSDIEYTGTITLTGDVILILGDGKTMTVNTSGIGIYGGGGDGFSSKNLTIYGQTAQGGTLSVTSSSYKSIACKEITVNSGTVNATSSIGIEASWVIINGGVVTAGGYGIKGSYGVIINGGQVTAVGRSGCIATMNDYYIITLGYTNADDFITFNETKGSVKIANGKVMTDGTNTYNDQTESDVLKALTNTTLRPKTYTVTFNSNGGSDVASQTVIQGMKATKPKPAPTRWGYVLSGWKLGEADYDFNSAVTSDLTLAASWREGEIVNYIDADGNEQTVTAAALTGNAEGGATLDDGWYVVNDDITYTGTINLGGDVNIILGDDKTMTVANKGMGDYNFAIYGESKALHIYGQSQGTGALTATTVGGFNAIAIGADNGAGSLLGIHGGVVTASTSHEYGNGIYVQNATDADGIIIDGGRVTASGNNSGIFCYGGHFDILGGQVTATGGGEYGGLGIMDNDENPGVLTLGCSKATDFISTDTIYNYSGQSREGEVRIATGQTLYDGTNTYDDQTPSATLAALINVTLRNYDYYRTVAFDINYGEGTNPETQIVLLGQKANEPTVDARTGYIFGGWKNGDANYDFSAAVTSNLYLTAKWTPITYTVQFDKNNDDATGTMDAVVATYDQWTSIPTCTFTAPEGYVMKEYGWNTAADGSGTKYEAEGDRFWNLATEQDAVVTLYAQWGKDIKLCTAEVPDQTLDGSYIYYKFEAANYGNAATGTEVKDGDKVLVVGTDYTFGQVYYYGTTNPCSDEINKIGDHFTVEIKGIGEYAGITTADFYIVSPEAEGTWGTLAWSINSDGDFSITGTGAMKETTQGNYPWYSKANGIRTITIGKGITSVAANAFAGTANVNDYGNVYLLTLPSTLTTIGENAFAYCTGLSIDLADLDGIDYPVNAFSYINSITGTLYDNADNSKTIEMMAFAGSNNVTIKGRTLYKDGNWNTICLPFDVKADNALLTDATVKELDLFGYYSEEGVYYSYAASNLRRTGFDAENGTLYLYFKDATANSDILLKAGEPYLIKWPSGENITDDLTFEGVKVIDSPQTVKSEDGNVSFRGTFSPVELTGGDASNLYLGVGKNDQNENVSTLYWPSSDKTINAFRGYFHINSTAQARAFMLNLDDEETTGIVPIENGKWIIDNGADAGWYDLSGRKLQSKPTKKGLYINNGKKVAIK